MKRWLAAVVATVLVAAAPATSLPALGQDPPPPPPTVTFEGVFQSPWVTRTGTWRLVLDVEGAPAGATLTAEVHERVATREEAVASLYTVIEGGVLDALPEVALDDVEADPEGTREVSLAVSLRQEGPPETRPGWAFYSDGLRPGVYPVDIRVTDADGTEQGRIVVLLTRVPSDAEAGADAPPLLVAPVVRLGGAPTIGPEGEEIPDAATALRAAELAAGLDGTDLPLTLVPRPESVEALARDETGAATLATLADATRTGQVVDGAYVDVPVSAWAERGMTDELTRQRDRGNKVLTEHLGRLDSSTWDASTGLTVQAAAELWPVGIRTVLLGRGGLGADVGPDAGPYAVDIGSGRNLTAVVPDASASDALARRDDPVIDTADLAAELALLVPPEGPARGIVLDAPEDWPADPEAVELLAEMLSHPDAPVTAVTVTDLLDRAADLGPRQLAPTLVQDLGAYPERLADARSSLGSYTSMVGHDDAEVGALDQRLLLSGARTFTVDEQLAYTDSVVATTSERFTQIAAPARQTFTLTAKDGTLPLTLLNDMAVPATVSIELQSGTGGVEFRDGPRMIAELQPGENRLRIPVRSRTFGDSSMDIVVRSADGTVQLDQVRYRVRSTGVPGIGLVLSIGAVAFLLIWWARHWRRDRRARKGGDPPPDASAPDPTPAVAA